jgi:hypothetical protein
MPTIHYQSYPTTIRSVRELPDEVPDEKLETFSVQTGRSAFFRVNDDASYTLESRLDREEVMRSISVGDFTVNFIARATSYLELGWLYTRAEVFGSGDDLGVRIYDSARYSQGDVEKYGPRQVIRWINEDRRELAKIGASFAGVRSVPKIFDAIVEVRREQLGAIGSDRLHGCIYDSYETFCRGGGYASDLASSAIAEAREKLSSIKKDLCT